DALSCNASYAQSLLYQYLIHLKSTHWLRYQPPAASFAARLEYNDWRRLSCETNWVRVAFADQPLDRTPRGKLARDAKHPIAGCSWAAYLSGSALIFL